MPFRRLLGFTLLALAVLGLISPLIRFTAPTEILLSDRKWGLKGCVPVAILPLAAHEWASLCRQFPWVPPIVAAVLGLALRPWRRAGRRADGRPIPDGIAGLTLILLIAWCGASGLAFVQLIQLLMSGALEGNKATPSAQEVLAAWFRDQPGWASAIIAPVSGITSLFAIRQLASPVWSSLAIVLFALAMIAADTVLSKAIGHSVGGLSGTEALASLWPALVCIAGIAWFRSERSVEYTGW